jgi:hypothetical protein
LGHPQAENRQEAEATLDRFVAKYGPKYDKAATCLAKDRDALLAFYAAPALLRRLTEGRRECNDSPAGEVDQPRLSKEWRQPSPPSDQGGDQSCHLG